MSLMLMKLIPNLYKTDGAEAVYIGRKTLTMTTNYPTYYQGSSIALIFRVRSRENGQLIDLSRYRAEAVLYTRLLGKKIISSTDNEPGNLAIHRISDYRLAVNIPPKETADLPEGVCSVKLTLTHKETGAVVICDRKILILEQTV